MPQYTGQTSSGYASAPIRTMYALGSVGTSIAAFLSVAVASGVTARELVTSPPLRYLTLAAVLCGLGVIVCVVVAAARAYAADTATDEQARAMVGQVPVEASVTPPADPWGRAEVAPADDRLDTDDLAAATR